MEVSESHEHSSLLPTNYGCKKFSDASPWIKMCQESRLVFTNLLTTSFLARVSYPQ